MWKNREVLNDNSVPGLAVINQKYNVYIGIFSKAPRTIINKVLRVDHSKFDTE